MDTLLDCRVCLEEIPADTNSETEEYVSYFCGLDCYQQWHQLAPQVEEQQAA
ncbi:DUF3330 domain-containing protein [Vogesella sp. LIG4]|uniref:DUF3330 domain-containing protein n=1 Tax=Vogesella sp. LIG4 TaxID=1192162 RepID=UPI00081FB2F0|nr:DUF3330 domain-containing protein [Vogesella sp. LIG4]SCK25496.1 protein of unknown function [Vogesella sp. LIG4]